MYTNNVPTSRMPSSAGDPQVLAISQENLRTGSKPQVGVLVPSELSKALEAVADLGHSQRGTERSKRAKDTRREREGRRRRKSRWGKGRWNPGECIWHPSGPVPRSGVSQP